MTEKRKGFTVGELIEHLKQFDQDLLIATECFDPVYETLLNENTVKEGFIWFDKYGILADNENEGCYVEKFGEGQKAVLIYI